MDLLEIPSLSFEADISVLFHLFLHEDITLLNSRSRMLSRKVHSNIQLLSLPNILKERLLKNLRCVERSLRVWFQLWAILLKNNTVPYWWVDKVHKHLVWNSIGIIDTKKTAINILKKEEFLPVDGFRLACVNYVEEEILEFWPRVKDIYVDENGMMKRGAESWETMYWISTLIERDSRNDETLQSLDRLTKRYLDSLTMSVDFANYAGVSYFLPKLPQLKINNYCRLLGKTSGWRSISSIMLISCLTFEQRKRLFKNYHDLLYQFLGWPLHYSFINVVRSCCEDLWGVLTVNHFCDILRIIHSNGEMITQYPSCNINLLGEFYMSSPFSLRTEYVSAYIFPEFRNQFNTLPDADAYRVRAEFFFTKSPAKQAIQDVFVTNSAAVCDFYNTTISWDALRNLALKYLPTDMDEKSIEFLHIGEAN